MVNYMQLPIQFTNYFLFPLHKKHLFAIKTTGLFIWNIISTNQIYHHYFWIKCEVVDCTVKMVNYMQLPIQFTNTFLYPLHKIHLFVIKQQVSLFGISY